MPSDVRVAETCIYVRSVNSIESDGGWLCLGEGGGIRHVLNPSKAVLSSSHLFQQLAFIHDSRNITANTAKMVGKYNFVAMGNPWVIASSI